MSESENESIVLKIIEALNRHDIDVIMEHAADDFIYIAVGRDRLDKEEWRKFIAVLFAAFPDFRLRVDRMVSQGNTVVMETTITGTHKGDYLGMPATGKFIELPAVYIYDFEAGKIKLLKYYSNFQSLIQQLRE